MNHHKNRLFLIRKITFEPKLSEPAKLSPPELYFQKKPGQNRSTLPTRRLCTLQEYFPNQAYSDSDVFYDVFFSREAIRFLKY